jgi:hypothetical protein
MQPEYDQCRSGMARRNAHCGEDVRRPGDSTGGARE